MSTAVVRPVGIIVLSLIGFASIFLVWVAGSHAYGSLSRIWQTVGFKGLLVISLAAYACSAGLLWDLRRAGASGFSMLLGFWLLTTLPLAFFMAVLMARFLHGGD